jgi:hypothetical protein
MSDAIPERHNRMKIVLNLLQIVLLPVCAAIATNPIAQCCFVLATILYVLRIYLETLDAPSEKGPHEPA